MRVDDVAGNICRALRQGRCRRRVALGVAGDGVAEVAGGIKVDHADDDESAGG